MEIKNRNIFIIIGALLIGVFIFGYFLSPSTNVTEKPIDEPYSGTLRGQGTFTLETGKTDTLPDYDGKILGNFSGTIYLLEKPFEVNADIDGIFKGRIIGDCLTDDCTVVRAHSGSHKIDGSGNVYLRGVVVEKETFGVEVPDYLKFLLAFVVVIGVLHFTGVLKAMNERVKWGKSGWDIIRKDDTQIYDEMITWLRSSWDILGVEERKDMVMDNDSSPSVIWFLIKLNPDNDSKLLIVKHTKNKFWMNSPNARIADWKDLKERVEKEKLLKSKAEQELKGRLSEIERMEMEKVRKDQDL